MPQEGRTTEDRARSGNASGVNPPSSTRATQQLINASRSTSSSRPKRQASSTEDPVARPEVHTKDQRGVKSGCAKKARSLGTRTSRPSLREFATTHS